MYIGDEHRQSRYMMWDCDLPLERREGVFLYTLPNLLNYAEMLHCWATSTLVGCTVLTSLASNKVVLGHAYKAFKIRASD